MRTPTWTRTVGTTPTLTTSPPSLGLDRDRVPDVLVESLDGVGWNNTVEINASIDHYNNESFNTDLNNDTIPDVLDDDIDGDGVDKYIDGFPPDQPLWGLFFPLPCAECFGTTLLRSSTFSQGKDELKKIATLERDTQDIND